MTKEDSKKLSSVTPTLETEITTLIFDAIGQYPTSVSCMFNDESTLTILIENIKTPLEEFLSCHCQSGIVQEYADGIQHAIERRVRRLIEKILNQPMDQASMSCKTETRWMGIFVLL